MLALPLSPFIQALDIAVVRGRSLLDPLALSTGVKGPVTVWAPWMLGYALVLSLGLAAIGMIVFRRASGRFAEMA